MKASDINDRTVLLFLRGRTKWASNFGYEDLNDGDSIFRCMPSGTPYKVGLAKMRQLIKRGLVQGCGCGCRGDYEITDDGKAYLSGSGNQSLPTKEEK